MIYNDKDFMVKFNKSYYDFDKYIRKKKFKNLLEEGKTKEQAYEELEEETIKKQKEELDKIQELQLNDDQQVRTEFEAKLAEDEAKIKEYNKSRNDIIDKILFAIKKIPEIKDSLYDEFFKKLKYNTKPTDEQIINYLDDLEKKVYLNDSIIILKLITDIIAEDTKVPETEKENKIKYYVDKISDEQHKIDELRNLSNNYKGDKRKSSRESQKIDKIIKTINAKRKREELRKAFVDEEFTKQKKTVISGRKNEARQNIIVPSEISGKESSDDERILTKEELNQLYNMYNPTKRQKVTTYMDKAKDVFSKMSWVGNLITKKDKTESQGDNNDDHINADGSIRTGFSGGNKKSKKRKNKRRKTTKRRKTKKAKK